VKRTKYLDPLGVATCIGPQKSEWISCPIFVALVQPILNQISSYNIVHPPIHVEVPNLDPLLFQQTLFKGKIVIPVKLKSQAKENKIYLPLRRKKYLYS
jgi:hypothetical protein